MKVSMNCLYGGRGGFVNEYVRKLLLALPVRPLESEPYPRFVKKIETFYRIKRIFGELCVVCIIVVAVSNYCITLLKV